MDLRHGDCLYVMPTLAEASVDAIVCDPPYGLSFMGKAWDHGVPGEPFWKEALRVAKPGAYLVAAGGTRTFHRLACAIEDAGWEMRDCLSWLYGSGFPKSLDVAKAIDKAEGMEREVVGNTATRSGRTIGNGTSDGFHGGIVSGHCRDITAPATDLARQWEGWGTALKPAWEPLILARKPLIGTVAANVAAHGTGALNIDGCRIAGPSGDGHWTHRREIGGNGIYGGGGRTEQDFGCTNPASGRWPANVVLDEEAAALLDAQSGDVKGAVSNGRKATSGIGAAGIYPGVSPQIPGYNDRGGASRFYYCAKSSRSERSVGLGDVKATHPTVKPLALMRWLCRLVTPPGGLILDPFMGSGTTGCAAVAEGFGFLGIEREAEYVEIARRRIAHWTPAPELSLGVA